MFNKLPASIIQYLEVFVGVAIGVSVGVSIEVLVSVSVGFCWYSFTASVGCLGQLLLSALVRSAVSQCSKNWSNETATDQSTYKKIKI